MFSTRPRSVLLALTISVSALLFVGACAAEQAQEPSIWDDMFYRSDLNTDLTLAPGLTVSPDFRHLIPTTVTDASKLFPIRVAGVLQPVNTREIRDLIKQAWAENKCVSLSGARHSMGGHVAAEQALHLDLTQFKAIQYREQDQSVTVQSGTTWKQLQRQLGLHQRAVRVMQDSNIFTIGGSLSANAHGKDPRYGSLIESVNWFKLLTASGEEIRCSRTENSKWFRAVIGGMGLFGVITEVNLKTAPNETYRHQIVHKPLAEMIPEMERLIQKDHAGLIEAQMSIDQENLLKEAQISSYHPVPFQPDLQDDVSGESSILLRKGVYRYSRSGDEGRRLRWFLQTQLGPALDAPFSTRNTAMAAPYRNLILDNPEDTDILQEYFVPTARAEAFLHEYQRLLTEHKMELLNVTVRKVNQDKDALVSYAQSDMYAFVVYYKIRRDATGQNQMEKFTQDLMDQLAKCEGRFYLIYRGYYQPEQVFAMYPKL